MAHFFFNSEALPPSQNKVVFTNLFQNTLIEFQKISDDTRLNVEKGIVTEKLTSEISLGDFNLKEIIEALPSEELKTIAYSNFTKYPVEASLTIDNEELFLEMDCYAVIDCEEYPALYLSYVAVQNEFAFSVPIHKDLETDIISLQIRNPDEREVLTLYNLYGKESNTKVITDRLLHLALEKQSLFEQLKTILKDPVFPNSFEKEFLNLAVSEQQSVIDLFQRAIERNIQTPLAPDTKIIKDVSPPLPKRKCTVYELRVYSPTAIRVYFHEGDEKNYLASIEKKSNANQNRDIRKAHNTLYKLILTNQ